MRKPGVLPARHGAVLGLVLLAGLGGCGYLQGPPEAVTPEAAVQASAVSAPAAQIARIRDGLARLRQSLAQQKLQREEMLAEAAAGDRLGALAGDVANNLAFGDYLLAAIDAAREAPGVKKRDRAQLRDLRRTAKAARGEASDLLDSLRQGMARLGAKPAAADGESRLLTGAAAPLPTIPGQKPFAIVRLPASEAEIERPLREAVAYALAERPGTAFAVIGVTPVDSALDVAAAKANADRIVGLLLDMGLAPERVAVAQAIDPSAKGAEVRLYPR